MKKQILTTILMVIVLSLTQINLSHAWPIPDTGQTKCYDNENEIPCPQPGEPFYGQDGNYLINEPSYTKLDAQGNDLPDDAYDWVMVRDNVTGLIWEIKTARNNVADYSNPNDADNRYTWYDRNPNTNGGYAGYYNDGQNTETYIQALNSQQFGGFSDWRLPSQQELLSIVKASAYNPAINKSFFMNTISDGFYWSSTPYVREYDQSMGVSFRYGYSQQGYKSNNYYVRAVRGLEHHTLEHWINNGDGTVTDAVTGLMWQQSTTEKSWSEALTFCKQLNLASYSDWRLPDKNELLSIIDFSKYDPSFDTNIFDEPDSQWDMYFWSSTTLTYDLYYAFSFEFLYGSESESYKSNQYNVRAVRGGQSYISEALFITSPAQASNWKIGSIMPIKWDTKNISGDVTISLSRDGGKPGTFETIAATTENNGTFDWTVTGPISINCMLKITPISDPDKETMQGLFTIADTTPPILQPINDVENYKTIPVSFTITVSDTTGGPIFLAADSSNYSIITSKHIQFEPSVIHNIASGVPQAVQITINTSYVAGPVTISITAFDSGNLSDTQSFSFNIIDAPNIPDSERQFLIDLYNSTYLNVYESWQKQPTHTDYFSMPGTECMWEGITCYNGGNYILAIDLPKKNARGRLPDSISNVTHLKSLNLADNQINSIPDTISALTELESINFNNNYLSNSQFLLSLKHLQNLTTIQLARCNLESSDISSFSELTQLQYLNISNNNLQGKIFDILSNLSQLETLIISNNNFGGQLPDNYSLTSLQTLDASNNQFWGNIPSGIQQLANLTHLNFSKNTLTGAIPNEIANLAQLTSLKLDRNQLSGDIPDSLMNLSQLQDNASDFSYNALYTNNSQLSSFLDLKQIGDSWSETQTLPVTDLTTGSITDKSITLFWAQISDTFPNGGLEISYAKAGESFAPIYPLLQKMDQEFTINGLLPGTQYQFRIRNCTDSHYENNNKIYSEYSTTVTATTTGTSPTLNDYIEEGRQYLRNASLDSVILANKSFENALAIQSDHEESKLFHALTRFAPLLDIDKNYTAGMPIENVKELLDVYGIDKDGRDINNWFADFKRDDEWNKTVLEDSPSPAEIQSYIQSIWISEIDAALNELETISENFNLKLEKQDICDECKEDIEVDYAEILLFKSMLNLVKTAAYISISYDIDASPKEILDKMYAHIINVHADILDKYTTLFTTLADAQTYMDQNARTAFITAIDQYFEASDFIRAETDDQTDDLLSFDRADAGLSTDEQKFRSFLSDLRQSLEERVLLYVGAVDETWEFVNDKDQKLIASLEFSTQGLFGSGAYVSSRVAEYGDNEFLGFSGNITNFIVDNNIVTITFNANSWRECNSSYCSYWNATYCYGSGTFTGNISTGNDSIYNGTYTITDCEGTRTGTFKASRVSKSEETYNANIGEFFADPISFRNHFPDVKHDPYTNELHVNGISTVSDRTYSGFYPDRFPVDYNGAYLDTFYIQGTGDSETLTQATLFIDQYFRSLEISESKVSDLSITDKILVHKIFLNNDNSWMDDEYRFDNAIQTLNYVSEDEKIRFAKLLNNRPVFYAKFHDLDIHDITSIIIEGPLTEIIYNNWYRIHFGGKVEIDPKTTSIGPNSELIINSIDFYGEGKYKIIIKDYSGNTYETSRYFISNPLDTFTEPDISPENHAYIDLPGSFHWQPIQNDKIDTLYYRVVIYTKNKSSFYPIYISERSTETFVTLPDNTIQPDSVYYFQIEALDGSHNINTHNIVRSQMRTFFTGTKTQPLTINQFIIEAHTNPIDAQTIIKCQISGALPDDLTGIALSGPAYYTLSTDDAVISENAWYIWQKNRVIPDGNYNLSITDSRNNESVSANASFVYNELPTTDIISAQKFIATTTPTLKWAAIPDGTYYYTAEIFDPYSRTLYTSSISTDTQVIIPENILKENQLYQWRVNVYDAPSGGQNSGVTLHKNLYVKTTAQPVITLSGPGHVSENTGVLTNAILVKLSTAPQTDLTLKLTSSDTSEITVQPTLIIPAGQTWGQFDISVVDDSDLDNTQGAGINAAADGWLAGNLLIEVYDNEMSADDYVQQGRQLIRDYSYQNVLDANASFYAALQIEPNHDLANFLYAISRLAAIVDMKAAYTPGTPLETLNEIADAYGVASTGRNIPNWTAGIYVGENGRAQVPEDCPSPQAVVNYFNHAFLDQVNGALDNLARIDQSFAFIVTQEEMGTDDMDDTEVDYGEVLLYRTALYGLKSALLIATAYNYDVPDVQLIIDKVADDIFDWKKDIYDKYAQLAMLATGGDTQLSEDAKTAMLNMIDSYFEASEFIRNEADDQSNDLLSIDLASDGQLSDESHFRNYLLEVKQALVSSSLLTAERTDQVWKFRNEQYQEIYLNVSWLLNNIFDGGIYEAFHYHYGYNNYHYGFNEFLGFSGNVEEFTIQGNTVSISLTAHPWEECEENGYYGDYCDSNYRNHCEGTGLFTGKISPSKDRIYDTQYTITDCEGTRTGTFKAELVDQTSEKFTANPGEFFDDPIHPREYAPEVKKDPYSDRAHIDGYSTFPDRTYSGVYPERYPEDHNGALIDKFYIHATSDPKIMTKMENYLDMYFQSHNVYESDLEDLSFSDKLLMFNLVESQYGNRWDFESNYSNYFNNVKSDLQNINDDQRALNSELFSSIPLLKATFSGLDVNDIVSATVSGPVNRFEIRWYNAFTLSKAAIDMASQSEISNRSELVIWHPGLLGNGKYTITLTDSNGDSYTQHRILTLNPLDNFNEQAIFPESESSITLPQTFSWQPITDETIQEIYYQIKIYLKDNQNFIPVYTSPRTTETYATLENLKPDTQYYWQVEAFDGSHDINSHNMVCSTKRTFYTGNISTLNIDDFILQSNILPDQDQSLVKIQLTGALPKDLTAISITGPINITIGNTDKAKMDENGWYQWSFIGLFVNGTYTVSVTDMRNNTPVEKQFTYTIQHVPCARIISAQKYIHTTTPVLKWENDPNLYFSIEIFNAAGKSIYTSPRTTATEIQVPQQLLEINQGYTWQVHSYLSDNDLQNQSSTNLMPIFILKASPKLTLNGPSNVIESDGTTSMTLTLSEIQTAPVTVKITSSDTSEIQTLASTTIPSGTKEVHFDITMIDDAETDGTQLVGIHARADHLDDASFAIHVYDNDISADDYVASGKKDIWKYTPQSVLDANTAFAAALGLSQNHEQANLFYAISRLAVLIDPNAPYTPGLPIDAPAELMDFCGVSSDGRDLLDWSADFYYDADDNILLNDTCPSPQAVIDYLQNIWITEIDGALDNLSRISSTFNMIVTQEEFGSDSIDDVEIDYGEVLLYRAALNAVKANLLVLSAYDYDVQSVAMLVAQMNQDMFNINTSLLDRYEQLFTLVSGKETQISDNAKNTLLLAIDTYFDAYAFITSETDDQTNDLMAFDEKKPKYESDEKSFRDHLTALKASLNNGNLLQLGSKKHSWELTTTDNLGGGIQLRIKTDAFDNFDSGSWSPNDYYSQSDSFIGYGGYLDEMILANDKIQMAIQTWTWNDYNMSSCEIDLQFQGNISIGYMEGTYTGTVCNESKTGTFQGSYIEQKQDIKEFAVGEFFNDPVNARAFAPKLTQDPYTDDILINGLRTYPDRTYSDVYPAGAPDDIILDSVGVYSINSEAVPTYVMVSVRVNELAPWMIDHININFNEFEQVSLTPVTLFFDPDTSVYASNYSQTALNNDTFWIDLYDKSGTGHDFKKSFTYNEMPMAELISPVQNEYVDTTTPTFSWQSVMDDKLGNRVFYKVVIFSSDHHYLYCSDVLQTNEFKMPPDVLADNTSYLYRIIVMDSPDSVSMNNLSISSSQIFFTGASQTMTIEQAGMMNIVNHDESTVMTRLKLKLSGIIKTDIQIIQVTGPETRSFDIYSMNFTDLPDGSFYWDTTEMQSGAYTLSVIDGRNSDTVSSQLTFSASTVERPTNLGMTDQSTIITTMPTLTWDPVSGISSYQVQILDLQGRVVYESPVISQTQFIVPENILKLYESYQWRVLALDNETSPQNIGQSESRRFYISRLNNRLSLSLPATVNETDGSITAEISVPENLTEDLTVQLTVTPSDIVSIQTPAVIAANSKSVEVPVLINDNSTADGNQTVQIIVSAQGYIGVTKDLTVVDDDNSNIQYNLLYEADNAGIQLTSSNQYAFKDSTHYVVWSDGLYSTNDFYNNYTPFVKLSISYDGEIWRTENIIETTYGSSNHQIAIGADDSINIVYNEGIGTGTYGISSWNLVFATNESGQWEKTILETKSNYGLYAASKLFFTESDGILNLFYNKHGWYRYNGPLYERNYSSQTWSDRILVSDLNYGDDNPDDWENILMSCETIDSKKILYISSGFYHLSYHGEYVYSDQIFKLSQDQSSTYQSEVLGIESHIFDIKDNAKEIVYWSKDGKYVIYNDQPIYVLHENETISNVSIDPVNSIILINSLIDDNGQNRSYASVFEKRNNVYELRMFFESKGHLLFSNGLYFYVQSIVNPKQFIISKNLNTILENKSGPTITDISPRDWSSNDTITIIGNNFSEALSVNINGQASSHINRLSPTVLTCLIPSGITKFVNVEVVNPDSSSSKLFAINDYSAISQERQSLLDLYNTTNGDNWTDKSNWNGDPGTECTWFGIQCDNDQIIGINMFDNNLVGTIPAEIYSLTQLQTLDLSENQLTGSISENIANLSQLTELNLSSNELSGELPSGFYQLTQLEIANLSDNQLTGEISPDIANLTKLIELILNHNQFSGELPSEITQLTSLEMLYLMHNQFGGHIPGDIGNLTQLIGLDVSSNAIIGSIPESIVNLTNLNEIYTSFDFNALRAYTQAADFMDTHFPGWLDTQTIAPSGMKMDASTSTSITLSWDPITFQLGDGGYEIWYQINGTTGITPGPKTGSKSETSLTVENLQSGTLYTFFIATWTESHTNNQNRVRCILYTALHVSTDSSQSPPVIATIPWQTISKGYEFAPINLNYLVSDADHAYTEMSWQVFGQNNLSIDINDGVASITILDANWTGSEIITFTAIDPAGLTDSQSVELAVIEKAHCQTAFRIPDSGQKKCYDNAGNEISCPQPGEPFYGQDGNYLINKQSYTKLDEQGNDLPDDAQEWVMVRDNVTGLIWEIKTEKDDAEDYSSLHDADNKYMWYDSNPETNGGHSGYFNNGQNTEAYIRDLNLKSFGGFSDWRLPSQHELLSIVTMNMNPAIDTNMFPNAKSDIYFSSTNHHYNHSWSSWLWVVNFENGNISSCERNSVYYIRAVRGENTKTTDHLYDNNDGTITDIANGLMWEKEIVSARPWADALSYCESLTLADYSDWRLPDKLSLQSIIDYSHYYPAINSSFFSVVPILDSNSGIYWTSTSYPLRTDMAFSVFFSVGYEGYRRKDSSFYVRSVRGGQNYLQTHLFIWTPMQASIWQSGETMPIKWDTQNIAGNVTISLSRQGGKDGTFETLATTENDGEYNWTVAGESSVNCMLKIEPVNEPDKGTQQSFFVISGGSSTHPVITTIPDQTITIDETFAPIPLDNYVSDMDHAITEITWQVTGQSKLQVNINNRIAEITFSPGWTGFERLVFTATDPDGLTSSTTTSFEMQKLYLYLSMPESAIESAGTIQGAVYVKKTLSSDLQINLTSSDTTEIQVPATVTISAGHSSVDFDCTIINDTDADGAQEIYIRATADGCDSAGHRTTIRDDEVSADTLVAEGRQFLSNHTHDDIFNAHSAFEAAISKDANHAEANFFIAATRLLNLLNTDELNDLLTSYGVSETGRDIYNWTADFQHDPHGDIELPENSPTFDTVQSWLLNHFIPEIDAALANLSKIDNSFATIITNDESGDYLDDPVEIDYGDILAFKLSLHALKSVIYIVCAYDLNADMDEIFEMLEEEIFDINDDLLDQYQNFLNLVTDGEIMISDNAKTEMLAAINLYFETSAFIRSEQDDQSDDFLQIDNDMDHDETEFQENLVKIEQSINETKPVTIGEIETDIETSWYIMMEPDSGSQHSASWWVITDEFNTLKHSDYYFHSSCIDFSHGCYGEIVTYEKSDDLLTVLAVSSDGTSITYTGRLTANENAIVSGTYIATYYDYNGKNTVTGNFSGSKEYSDTRVEDNTLTVNAGEIFNDPIDIRTYLPELATDPYTHDILIVSESSFPDRTFSGILPDKWPTKGDVYIDKVRVLGIRSQSFYPSYLELCINGLASWDIKEIMVSGPGFWPVTFSPIQISSDILSNDQLYVKLNEQSYDGDYHFSVTDNNGHTYEQTKHFTRNNIFVSEDSVIPESNAFVETTTPTFVLPDLSQSNSGDMNAGLIAYYPLDGNADDFSVYSNNGIINGSVPFSQGAIGSCAYFNGEYSNYIRIPHQTWLNFSNAFSISLWINAESESRTVLAKGRDIYSHYRIDSYGKSFSVNYTDDYSDRVSVYCDTAQFNLHTWYHVVCIADNNTSSLKYYLNGQRVKQVDLEKDFNITTTYDLVIGRHDTTNDGGSAWPYPFNGYVDDIRIYNRALSDNDVQGIYQNWSGNATNQVPLYYNISIWEPFKYQSGRKLIYRTITSNNQWTVPENILSENQFYSWDLYVQDAPDIDVANNVQGIVQDRLFHTGADDTVTIKKVNIQSRQSSKGIETLIDLGTMFWTSGTSISITGPINTIIQDQTYGHAYTVVSGIIPDGIYDFSISEAGKTEAYTKNYQFKSISIAQNLTIISRNEKDYVFTTIPVFSWSPVINNGIIYHSNLQIFEEDSPNYYDGQLVYESPISLKTQATIPANILKANNAYRYRVMVYDSPTDAQNVSVTDFQRFYIKMTDPALMLTIPTSVNEKDGILAQQGAVFLNTAPVKDVVITLTSIDPSEIKVPAQLIIPKGQMSAAFNIQVIDDDELDNDQTAIVKATAIGWEPCSASITVIDDDEDWKTIDLPFPSDHITFHAMWGTSDDNIFVVGSPATIVHYDGTNWETMALPDNIQEYYDLFDIHGTDENNIIAVGSHTTVLKYDGSQWQSLTSNESGFMLNSVWTSGENIYAAGDKYLALENGQWQERSDTYAPFYSIWGTVETEDAGYTNTYLYATSDYRIVKQRIGDNSFTPESQELHNTFQSIFGIDNVIYAVGDDEIMLKDKGQWTEIETSAQQEGDRYFGLWTSAHNDILLCGIHGTIINMVDSEWKRMQTGTQNNLFDIWGSSEKDVYAVGESGTILRARPRNVVVNHPPNKPVAVTPVHESTLKESFDTVALESGSFSDPDGDQHYKTIWRVRRADQDYYRPGYAESFNTEIKNAGTAEMTHHTINDLMSGMKYYWQVGYMDDSDGLSGISWSDEHSFKIGNETTDENPPTVLPGEKIEDYRMISFPYWMKDPNILSTIQLDTINTETNKIGTYLPSRGGYIEGNSLQIEPGRAYWFLSRKGLDLAITGVQVNMSEIIEVPLWYNPSTGNGWNMIGAPNNKTYLWAVISIIVYDDLGNIVAGPYNVLSEEAGKYIDSRLWEWEDGTYEDNEEEIRPYEGYWVKAKALHVSLQFPVDGFANNAIKNKSFVRWLKELVNWVTPSSLQATSDTPPMPMGLSGGVEVSEDKCFIGVLEIK